MYCNLPGGNLPGGGGCGPEEVEEVQQPPPPNGLGLLAGGAAAGVCGISLLLTCGPASCGSAGPAQDLERERFRDSPSWTPLETIRGFCEHMQTTPFSAHAALRGRRVARRPAPVNAQQTGPRSVQVFV